MLNLFQQLSRKFRLQPRIWIALLALLAMHGSLCAQSPDFGTPLDVKPYRHSLLFADPYARMEVESKGVLLGRTGQMPLTPVSVHIVMDTTIRIGMGQYANPQRSWRNSRGYRVQIYNGDRDGAANAQYDFMELQTGEEVYVEFESPNFKVRVGNFEYEDEARTFARQLHNQFSGAYVVPSQIVLPQD